MVPAADVLSLLGSVTLLDVRWRLGGPPGLEEFRAGHVPGAAYVDLETVLADPPGPRGRHPLPDAERFASAMRAAGVSDRRPVVVYDAVSGTSAARCWWLLRYHGHEDVRVLDGGWAAWLSAGGPVATGAGSPPVPGDFSGSPGHMPVLDADMAVRRSREGTLVDVRSPERFRGEEEPVDPVAGHIPGAVNVPTAMTLVDPGGAAGGLLRPVPQLRETYRQAGVDLSGSVGVYCGSGVTAAHGVLALEAAGVTASLYPGSWSEWVTDPGRPVATGPS